jgi:hypothetical protein
VTIRWSPYQAEQYALRFSHLRDRDDDDAMQEIHEILSFLEDVEESSEHEEDSEDHV